MRGKRKYTEEEVLQKVREKEVIIPNQLAKELKISYPIALKYLEELREKGKVSVNVFEGSHYKNRIYRVNDNEVAVE